MFKAKVGLYLPDELNGVLTRAFSDLDSEVLVTLLKIFSINIPLR